MNKNEKEERCAGKYLKCWTGFHCTLPSLKHAMRNRCSNKTLKF
jgi:hypothetical protein